MTEKLTQLRWPSGSPTRHRFSSKAAVFLIAGIVVGAARVAGLGAPCGHLSWRRRSSQLLLLPFVSRATPVPPLAVHGERWRRTSTPASLTTRRRRAFNRSRRRETVFEAASAPTNGPMVGSGDRAG